MKLTIQNIPAYLRSLALFPDVNWSQVKVSEVTKHTNVNYVFKAVLGTGSYRSVFLKQAFNFVKVAPSFSAPLSRQKYEKLAINYLQQYWSGRIPKVIHHDPKNHVLVLTDISQGTKLLAEEIEKGRLHLKTGEDLGTMMAGLHFPTYSQKGYPVRGKQENAKHVDFIFDFRLRGAKELFPKETKRLFSESIKASTTLIYADWASKNILVTANGKVRLVDFENLVRFDPAFDIGYALAHWVLEVNQENKAGIVGYFKTFEEAYQSVWRAGSAGNLDGILRRAAKYTGAMMLHRFAGVKNTNRLDQYLAQKDQLTKIAGALLNGDFPAPSFAVLNSCREAIAP